MVRSNASRELSHLLYVAVTVVVIAALYFAKIVFLPLALAMLFAFLLAPLVTLLEKIHLPRVLAIVLVMLVFGSGLGAIGWTIVTQLIQVTEQLPDYRANIADKVATFHRTQDTSFSRAQREVESLSGELGISGTQKVDHRHPNAKPLGASADRPVAVQEVAPAKTNLDSLQGIFGPLEFLLLITVFTFFMLLEREDLRNRLIRLTGQGHLNLMTQAMDEAGTRVSRYFSLQLLVNVCYGAGIFLGLHFIGLPHALLWGSFAGISRFIPYIGAPFAALLPTVLSMAVFNGWDRTLLIMAMFFCLEVVTANFVEPRLYGKHTGLSSLAILVAAVFWTLIWGPIGLILSVPLTVCLVVVGAHAPNLKFLTVLLGDQPVMLPDAQYYQRLLANDEHEASQVVEQSLKEKSLIEMYETVLLPALSLSELDRHRNALDEPTIQFINETTKEFVEEFGLRSDAISERTPVVIEKLEASNSGTGSSTENISAESSKNVLCVPVRDDADEIIAIMLAQLLERTGLNAQAIPLRSVDEMVAAVTKAQPDLVYLSALPPYAMSHARGLYRRMRAQHPQLPIVIGLWNYSGDPLKAAREISGGEQGRLSVTLSQAVLQASWTAPVDTASAETSPDKKMNQPV